MNQTLTSRILQATDIVTVISARVPLRKAGKDHSACCPFHDEKTPSFTVSSKKQFYYCFGCGAHGDAIKFLRQYDGLSFRKAQDELARSAGIEIDQARVSPRDARRYKANVAREAALAHECGVLHIARNAIGELSADDARRADEARKRIAAALPAIYYMDADHDAGAAANPLFTVWHCLSLRAEARQRGRDRLAPHKPRIPMDAHPIEIAAAGALYRDLTA